MKRWEVDEAAVAKMLQEPSVASHLIERAQLGVDKARASAPVRTGRYRDSLQVLAPRLEGDVLVVGYGTDSSFWHFVEYGSGHTAPHRILGASAEVAADKVQHL